MIKKFKNLTIIFIAFLIIGITNVNAEEMSTNFTAILTDGKLVINSIAPTNEEEAGVTLGEYISEKYEGFSVDVTTCNITYTKCNVIYNYSLPDEETHEVDFEYNYDESIKLIIDEYVNNIPDSKDTFEVKDLELINYWVNEGASIINYSGELKSYINHKNFNIDLRAGGGSDFTDSGFGVAKFSYNDITYYINTWMGVIANYVIYVPDNTELDKDVLMNAAQTRINNYVGSGKVTLEYIGTINQFFESIEGTEDYDYYNDEYNTEGGELYFLHDAAGNYYYKAIVGDKEYYLIIVRSTDDMVTPQYISSDINSNVTISSNQGIIPLDTLIRANKITSGEDYENIIKKLNITYSEIFDLKLYSNTLENYFTKLEDGTFEVRIPIADKFNNKDLVVYYVDEEGKTIEYSVKIENGYAVFNTNHFSLYTLAEKFTIENPQTYDGVVNFILLGSISIIGIIGCVLYFNKNKKLS